MDITVKSIAKSPWSLKMVADFYQDHALNEIVSLAGTQIYPLNGMDMDFFIVEVSIDNNRGFFGPIGPIIAEQIKIISKQKLFTSFENFYRELQPYAAIEKRFPFAKVIGVVDCAIQDAVAKQEGKSVAEIFSAKEVISEVPCYASMITVDIDGAETENIARALTKLEFWGQKWHLKETETDERKSLITNIKRLERLRLAIGESSQLMLEVHGRWTPQYLEKFINESRDFNITWIEDPLSMNNLTNYQAFKNSKVPICIGEKFSKIDEFNSFISKLNNFVIHVDIIDCGGYRVAKKVKKLCENCSKLIAYHGKTLVPSLHLIASNSSEIQQIIEFNPIFEPERQKAMRQKLVPERGRLKFDSKSWKGLWQKNDNKF